MNAAWASFGCCAKAAQRFPADVSFANVPMPIDPRVVWRPRIVEVNGANIFQTYRAANHLNRRFQPFLAREYRSPR